MVVVNERLDRRNREEALQIRPARILADLAILAVSTITFISGVAV
jgi:hypothetical protein